MFRKYLCVGHDCAVFVFGISTDGICPGCGQLGIVTDEKQGDSFYDWFNITRGELHV